MLYLHVTFRDEAAMMMMMKDTVHQHHHHHGGGGGGGRKVVCVRVRVCDWSIITEPSPGETEPPSPC